MSENDPNKKETGGKSQPLEPIPAYRDTFIHFLFGSPGNESILLNFLNAVLESDGQPPAKSVVAKNPFNPQTFVTDKFTILDVKATDERGDIFAVEFQTSERTTFADRLTYYGSRTFGGQMYKGDPYSILRAVIAIAVTTFEMFPQLESIHNSFFFDGEGRPESYFHPFVADAHIGGDQRENRSGYVFASCTCRVDYLFLLFAPEKRG